MKAGGLPVPRWSSFRSKAKCHDSGQQESDGADVHEGGKLEYSHKALSAGNTLGL